MLNIPQKTDHALALMRHLAAASVALSLEEVARQEGISQGYLEEVARLLRSAKLIEGRRGAHGGYVLMHDASDISVADVVTAIEGHKWTVECLGEKSKRPNRNARNEVVWKKVQAQVMTALRGISIASLVESHAVTL